MTTKQRALKAVAEKGCRVEQDETSIEVFPPADKAFDDCGAQLTSLVCFGWEDVAQRLAQFDLVPYEEESL